MQKCKKITVGEFRQNLPEYANLTKYKGECFIITRNGKDVGAFISMDDLERLLRLDTEQAGKVIEENSGEMDCLAITMSNGL